LDAVRLKGLRGIRNLRVASDYPVPVVAGPSGCGKSTVLFACAAADVPAGRSARAYVPAALFSGSSGRGRAGGFVDAAGRTALEFYYLAAGARYAMVWRKGRFWSRTYMGRKDVGQPEREMYLRTLANLTNPSEIRGLLQLGHGTFDAEEITPDLPLFARRILPEKYRGVSLVRGRSRDLLFAGLDHHDTVRYSKFHMSAGERAILRMLKDVSSLKPALVLIDQIEDGPHPWTQQLMLKLQRIALRNGLRVVVTAHSPMVLYSVHTVGGAAGRVRAGVRSDRAGLARTSASIEQYLKRWEFLDESVVAEKMREAADHVRRYLEDENLRGHPSVGHVGLAVVFHGWEMAACEAVGDGSSADDHGRTTKRGRS